LRLGGGLGKLFEDWKTPVKNGVGKGSKGKFNLEGKRKVLFGPRTFPRVVYYLTLPGG